MKTPTPQVWLLAAVLLSLLGAAVWLAVDAWTAMDRVAAGAGQISGHGVLALVIGAVGTFALGVGLMALVFYSSRKGVDEAVSNRSGRKNGGA
ncbi:MAG TPA: hypothetical protein VFO41_15285 [Alphaproteobacteria bacterium]|nr:hypothetical protein [Alphaproteobacteria bacterium]